MARPRRRKRVIITMERPYRRTPKHRQVINALIVNPYWHVRMFFTYDLPKQLSIFKYRMEFWYDRFICPNRDIPPF